MFFKILDRAFGLRMMARPRRELAVAHFAQLAAHRLLGDADAKLLEHPLAKIDDPPTHDAMDRRRRTFLDHARERGAMLVLEPRRLAGSLAVDEAVGAVGVETQHPIADDLEPDPADLRRLASRRAVVDRRQSEQSARLRPVLRALRYRPQSDLSTLSRSAARR